jgi:hypothetical protein
MKAAFILLIVLAVVISLFVQPLTAALTSVAEGLL